MDKVEPGNRFDNSLSVVKSYNALLPSEGQKALEDQLAREVELLKEYDPDKALKKEFETASLHDLKKYLDE